MLRARLSFRLHRTAIVLICVTLLVALMQGASWFSLSHQMARSAQVDELADTLIRQVVYQLAPLMADSEGNNRAIQSALDTLTKGGRILDAGVYAMDGSLIARAGENISLRDRLAIDHPRAGSYFNHQLVRTIIDKDGPSGFVRLTLDTHVLETEAKQVDNTTNLLRLMILLSLAIGIILARTLLEGRRSRWQQSPYLLTASTPLAEHKAEGRLLNNSGAPADEAASPKDKPQEGVSPHAEKVPSSRQKEGPLSRPGDTPPSRRKDSISSRLK